MTCIAKIIKITSPGPHSTFTSSERFRKMHAFEVRQWPYNSMGNRVEFAIEIGMDARARNGW